MQSFEEPYTQSSSRAVDSEINSETKIQLVADVCCSTCFRRLGWRVSPGASKPVKASPAKPFPGAHHHSTAHHATPAAARGRGPVRCQELVMLPGFGKIVLWPLVFEICWWWPVAHGPIEGRGRWWLAFGGKQIPVSAQRQVQHRRRATILSASSTNRKLGLSAWLTRTMRLVKSVVPLSFMWRFQRAM